MATCSACCKSLGCSITTLVIGILLVIGSSIFIGLELANKLIDSQLKSKLVISPNSFIFSEWLNPPIPIYMQYWMFNVTNSEQVIQGQKPTVEEIGPFTYQLYQPKTDIAFYLNSTVSYKFNHALVYESSMSIKDPHSVKITQLNIPLLTIQSLVKNFNIPKYLVNLLILALNDSDVFVSHTVHEWLFGYPDPVFHAVHVVMNLLHKKFSPNFGLFLGYNNSNDGTYLVYTGEDDITKSNQICKWNSNNTLSWWSSAAANMINGTDGTFFSPKVSKSKNLYAFVTDICRSVYFRFESDSNVKGIDTWRFIMPAEVFANATINQDNAGFCVPAKKCLDSGVLDISTCKQGAPIVLSSPHFYLSAPQYIHGVNGMHPNKKEHETYVDIEPLSGSVFSGAKRLQINAYLKNQNIFKSLKHVHDVILPILWLNESVKLDDPTANMFKSDVVVLINFVHALPYVLLGVGLALALIGCILIYLWHRRKNNGLFLSVPLEDESNDK